MISTSYRLSELVDLDVFSNFVRRLSQIDMPLLSLPEVRDPRALQAAGLLDDELALQTCDRSCLTYITRKINF
jgi:hypothetical protein